MIEQAMPVRSGGKVRVSEYGDVQVHTYISPSDGLLTNTQIVEGPTKLIVFDGQFFLPYAEEAATYIESLAKPVDSIVLSHIHLDHWSGLPVLAKRFPDTPICGIAGVGDYLRTNGQKILDARRPAFGDCIPSHPPVLTGTLPEGDAWIDGVRFEFKRFIDAESALQLVALMPDQQTLLGFDLIFGPDDHVFTVMAHFDNWIAILEGLNALPGYSRILSGHGEPTVHSAIGATIVYLRKAREVPQAIPRSMRAG